MVKKRENVVDVLKKVGALITDDHFVGTSGRHIKDYINKDFLYVYPKEASKVGKLFAERYKNRQIDVVAAPALGGIVLSQWTAYYLSKFKKKEILGVYTEKTTDGNQLFTRGYDKFIKGKNVLVIEDLTTTGGSIKKVIKAVKSAGGKVVEACVMVNRDPQRVTSDTIGTSFSALGIFSTPSYEEKECPMCKQKIKINTQVGHGKKYLEEKRKNTSKS